MGQGYLIDSNVIIDYISSKLPSNAGDFVEQLFKENFIISVVAKIEVLGFNDLPDKVILMEEFINMAIQLPLDKHVIKQTIELRRNYKKLKLGDAIIAATAMEHDLTLISRNVKDFIRINGLKLLNPYIL